jgi:uroporphyrinogen decarboxylase
MFRSTFMFEDWGCTFGAYQKPLGFWLPDRMAVNGPQDWRKLKVLDPAQGVLGEMLQVVKGVRAAAGDDIFSLATVFCPFMVARQLTGDRIKKDLWENPRELHAALEVITETVIRFANACLDAGANGIFFATQSATTDFMSVEQYREFGHPYNLRVLGSFTGCCEFTMLHICGQNIMFEEFLDYPVQAYNWDDQVTEPSLVEARKKTGKCLIGGINKMGVLRTGTPQDVEREAQRSLQAAGKQRFILAPGCGFPMDVPEANLRALRAAVGR